MRSPPPQVPFLSSSHPRFRRPGGRRRRVVRGRQRPLESHGLSQNRRDSALLAELHFVPTFLSWSAQYHPGGSLRLLSVRAETPAETVSFERAADTNSDGSASRQAALFILQILCCVEDVSPPRTMSEALARARKRVAAMAQLRMASTEQNALGAKHDAAKRRFAAVQVLSYAIGELSCQQHEFDGQHSEIAGLRRDTVSVLASRCATLVPSETVETRSPSCKRACPS